MHIQFQHIILHPMLRFLPPRLVGKIQTRSAISEIRAPANPLGSGEDVVSPIESWL